MHPTRQRLSWFLRISSLLLGMSGVGWTGGSADAAPNVLFIAVDDLRPTLGCYGDPVAVTPNIDRLAQRGLVFHRAYCQEAVCNPSRASLITGRRPDTIRVWDLAAHFRDAIPGVITLPEHFKRHGYVTRSIGKILHGSGRPSQDPPSWSRPAIHDTALDVLVRYALPENLDGKGLKRNATEAADVADNAYIDGMVRDEAVRVLAELKKGREPFFLAVGFRKPHLPFCAPTRYWDLYDRAKIPAPVSTAHPAGAPEWAVRSWREVEGYRDIPKDGPIPPEKVAELRHGYYACTSYVDAMVGGLLDALDRLELTRETIVLLWGDHGFHLGEQGLWTKANNYELATRVPLILAVPSDPDRDKQTGRRADALVELVDVYPTLVELCGLPLPDGLEGTSLVPLLADPNRSWKRAALSQFPRARTNHRHRGHGDVMGYAARTDRYRYVRWQDHVTGKILARELYDHQTDPEEMVNLADMPPSASTIEPMDKLLDAGWRGARPASE